MAGETKNYFPTRLRLLREFLRWTQEEVADVMGVTKHTVRLYEAGGAAPRFAAVMKLIEEWGIPYWAFTRPNVDLDEMKRLMLQKQADDLLLAAQTETPVAHSSNGNGAHGSEQNGTNTRKKELSSRLGLGFSGLAGVLAGAR